MVHLGAIEGRAPRSTGIFFVNWTFSWHVVRAGPFLIADAVPAVGVKSSDVASNFANTLSCETKAFAVECLASDALNCWSFAIWVMTRILHKTGQYWIEAPRKKYMLGATSSRQDPYLGYER